MQIDKLQVLFRKIRESQGISQAKLAEKAGITQGAITHFEHMRATISDKKLMKMAPMMNLNPDYIEKKTRNPFKQADKNKLIKMYISENEVGELDFSLLQFIAQINERAFFYILKPSFSLLKGQRIMLHSAYALLVKDADENVFVFRRKRTDDVFDYFEFRRHLIDSAAKEGKYFGVKMVTISESIYEKIQKWGDLNSDEFSHFLNISGRREKWELLNKLLNDMIFLEADSAKRQRLVEIKKTISKMSIQQMNDLILRLIPRILEI